MKLPGLVLFLAWATAATAAEPPPIGAPDSLPGFAFKPFADDYYPASARSRGEQGTVKIRLCHDEKGKVTDSTLAGTSGFEKLDQAALRMGKAYRIKPGVIDGQRQSGCVVVPVQFSLKETPRPADSGERMNGDSQDVPTVKLVPLTGMTWVRQPAAQNE